MSGIAEDRDRQVVPRWRSFDSTQRRGELASFRKPEGREGGDGGLQHLKEDWKERPGIWVAADLVSSAVVLGREGEAIEAARFLLDQKKSPSGARRIAALCLRTVGESLPSDMVDVIDSETPPSLEGTRSPLSRTFHIQIHATRARLVEHPRSPVLWNNLARLYTSVGSREKADRAMKVALSLAPENRLILRGASRMLLHLGQGRDAHRLLSEARSLRSDPWILSAEIATAAALKRSSKNIKEARRIIDSGRFSPFHLSELASALGTLEAVAGNRRGGRKLIEMSLRQPSENSIAQAAWLVRRMGMSVSLGTGDSGSWEADAWNTFRSAKWGASLEEAKKWQADQPFSSRPAIHGSHIASTIFQDYNQALEILELGLLANPDDNVLINNFAFSLAQNGDVERAAKALQRVALHGLGPSHRLLLTATAGLIAFRSGRHDEGRALYRTAIDMAQASRNPRGGVARIYLAFEELRIESPIAEGVRVEALNATKDTNELWVIHVRNQLEGFRPKLPFSPK